MKRFLSASLPALFAAAAFAGAEPATVVLTLPDVLARAAKDNLDVASAELDLQKLHSRYWEALGSALPEVSLEGNATRYYRPPTAFMNGVGVKTALTNVATLGVSARQPLYMGGKVGTAVKIAHDAVHMQEDVSRAARDEAAYAARRLYYQVLLTARLAEIQKENLDRSRDHLAVIRKRYDQGVDSDLALRRQEVEEAEARSLLLQAESLRDTALLDLKDFLRMDLDLPVDVRGVFDDPRPSLPEAGALEKAALDHRPEVSAARAAVAVQADLRRFARTEFQPNLSAYGQYQHFVQSKFADFTPKDEAESLAGGLSLRWNFFRGGQDVQKVRQARMDWERALLQAEKTERGVRREVRERRLSLVEAAARAGVQREASEHARLALKSVEARYAAGQAGQLELNDATLALNRARLAESQALEDYWTGRAGVERAVGISLEEVQP